MLIKAADYHSSDTSALPIHLAPGVDLSLDAATATIAILGVRGSGKTYSAAKLAEELSIAGAQVVVLDPLDVWWSLRLAADGVGAGLPFVVLGGSHGDLPLEISSAEIVADLVVEERLSVVLSVALLTKQQQRLFAAAFFERLYARKAEARYRQPMMVITDEADRFAPQTFSAPAERRCLEAVDDLSRRGRVFGIGLTLVGQRTARINKDVLSQSETMILHRTLGPQDREAIRGWVKDQVGGEDGKVLDSLPTLPTGTAWIWSPSAFKMTVQAQIAPRRTYDASSTPRMGATVLEPQQLDPASMTRLREHMARLVVVAEEEDPQLLRRRIAELQQQIAVLKTTAPAPRVERVVEQVEVPVISPETQAAINGLAAILRPLPEQTATLLALLEGAGRQAAQAVGSVAEAAPGLAKVAAEIAKPLPVPTPMSPVSYGSKSDAAMPSGQRRILEAMARRHPVRLSRSQIAVLARLSASGGTTTTYFNRLKQLGYTVEADDLLALTQAGLDYLGADRPQAAQTTAEIVALWRPGLPDGARRILDALVAAYPDWLTVGAVATAAGLSESSGTFSGYLGTLRNNGLIEQSKDRRLRAHPALFPGS